MKSSKPIYPPNFCALRTCGKALIPKKAANGRWPAISTFMLIPSCKDCYQDLRKQRSEDLRLSNLNLSAALKSFTGV